MVWRPQMWSPAWRICSAVKPRWRSRSKPGDFQRDSGTPRRSRASVADDVGGEGVAQFEDPREGAFDGGDLGLVEPHRRQGVAVDVGGALEGHGADHVADDLVPLLGGVAQAAEGRVDGLVGDLEVAAPGQLLELDQGEVGLDAGGVAVHLQADGPRGGETGRLGVAVAVLLAHVEGGVPGAPGGVEQRPGAVQRVDAHHPVREALVVLLGGVVGGAAVVADHPQHGLAVLGEVGEGAEHRSHLGRGGVGDAGEHRGEGGGDGPALVGVVGDAAAHEQRAQVGVAQAQGAVVVGALGDLTAGELGHGHRDRRAPWSTGGWRAGRPRC